MIANVVKLPEVRESLLITVKFPVFLLSVWMQSEISFLRSPIVVLFGWIEGPQRYVSETTTKVEKETLVIGYKENNSNSKNVKLYIAAPDLKSVKLQGVGSFNCRTALRLDQLKITLSGVGGAEISDLVCETLKVRLDGVGSVNIRVDCDELTARADGVGSMTLKGKARKADISKGGVGGVNTRGLKVGE